MKAICRKIKILCYLLDFIGETNTCDLIIEGDLSPPPLDNNCTN